MSKTSGYNFEEIEKKWLAKWEKERVYVTPEFNASDSNDIPHADKAYTLVMFPYPSGDGLHTGHARVYTGTDILARFFRMSGKKVLHPMGWDAFGLPAENAAIKLKKNPRDITKANIANFKRQMNMLGISYDWGRELDTTDPDYYAITQFLFTEFFKRGLLHKKNTPVYYCPHCKTGLALEEVMGDGTHERCGNIVEKRNLPQWIFRITKYANSLLQSLDGLDWPSGILEMQRNWIGKKEGMIIHHNVKGMDMKLDTFTAYPAWSFADTFIVISPEHDKVSELVKGTGEESDVMRFVDECSRISPEARLSDTFEKKGVFTGRYAIDPFTGEDMPIWVGNFALMDFGTGIIRCSAHDERDYEFAVKYGIHIREVVDRVEKNTPVNAHMNKGILKDSGKFSGRNVGDVVDEMNDWIVEEGIGDRHTSYHLRDWIFSRQRYWGEPIPMIYCEACAREKKGYLRLHEAPEEKFAEMHDEVMEEMDGWYPLEKGDLPLELPHVESYEPLESGSSPLSALNEWTTVPCPHCGGEAVRESDTMPNWAGSCWYFLQFPLQKRKRGLDGWYEALQKDASGWLPVDWYVGGAEHAVLHLLYARYWIHVLNDMGVVNFREPFLRLRNVGMLIAEDGRKMSKSKGNVINPDNIVAQYGTDVLRTYEMFMAPFNQEVRWSTQTLQGVKRFLNRVWQMYTASDKLTNDISQSDKKLDSELQNIIIKITNDITNVKFNTPIASCMEFLNLWEKSEIGLSQKNAKQYLQLLAPFAPFMTEEIWREVFGESESIHISHWPEPDESLMLSMDIEIPVQVNGKVREKIVVPPDASESYVTEAALRSEKIQKWIEGNEYSIVYIPGRILNIVVNFE